MTTRTWVTSYNNALDVATFTTLDAQGKRAVRMLKDVIKLAGYTVLGSSDGAGAGALDGNDRITDDSKVVFANAASNHTWIALARLAGHLPNSKFTYIVIDCNALNSPHLFTVAVGSSAPTGGSATTAPTMTTGNRQIFTSKQFLHATAVNSKYHHGYSDAGDWFFHISQDGTGRVHFTAASFIAGSSTYETGTNYPTIDIWSFSESGTGSSSTANLQIQTHIVMFNTDGSAQVSGTFGVVTPSVSSTNVMSTFTSAGSTITGKQPKVPILIGQFSGVTIALKGTLVDIWFGPYGTNVNQGLEEPSTGTSEHALMGEHWYPNGGVSPQL